MDAIILPFVLGAIWLAAKGRTIWASASLALAVGVKVWPVLLLPLLLAPTLSDWRKTATALAVFAVTAGLLATPVLYAGLDETSGFLAYGRHWQVNDALFMTVAWLVNLAAAPFAGAGFDTTALTKLLTGSGLIATSLWLARRGAGDAESALLVMR